jgi:hypothetical protein
LTGGLLLREQEWWWQQPRTTVRVFYIITSVWKFLDMPFYE